MKHKLLFFMAFFLPYLAFAQGNVNVKGSVIGMTPFPESS